jgi:hypothetical protein
METYLFPPLECRKSKQSSASLSLQYKGWKEKAFLIEYIQFVFVFYFEIKELEKNLLPSRYEYSAPRVVIIIPFHNIGDTDRKRIVGMGGRLVCNEECSVSFAISYRKCRPFMGRPCAVVGGDYFGKFG